MYVSQIKKDENHIERELRKIWRLANFLEKKDPKRSQELRAPYWTELRQYKQSYVGMK